MVTWIPCDETFITGDVIRWVEPIWKPKARRTQKSVKIGTRKIVGQVVICERDGWVHITVSSDETDLVHGWTASKLDGVIRRRRGPIGQGGVERMLWSDESARSLVASRYMGAAVDELHSGPTREPGIQATTRAARGNGVTRTHRRGRHPRKKGPRPRPPSG